MAEEGAYLIRGFGERMCSICRPAAQFLTRIHGEAVGEEPFRRDGGANNATRALRPRGVSSTIRVPSPTDVDTG